RVIGSANDYRTNLKPWVYLSTDGGSAWTNYQVQPVSSTLYYGDPGMAFGHAGNAYFSYLGYQALCTAAGGMYISHSSDAGASFTPPYQLAPNVNVGQLAL